MNKLPNKQMKRIKIPPTCTHGKQYWETCNSCMRYATADNYGHDQKIYVKFNL